MKIYLDMDDCLVDFKGGLEEFNIKNDKGVYHDRPKSEWTPTQVKLDRQIVDCMNEPGFFLNLPLNKGADELWRLVCTTQYGPFVLTAYPQTCTDPDRVAREKKEWVEKYFKAIPDRHFICCARNEKADYAVDRATLESNILIDDLEANCHAWEDAGGIAILFKDSEQAVQELTEVLRIPRVKSYGH